MSEPKRTPLFDFNVANGGRMVDFAGWEMPVQYTSIVEEHKATREAAGLFDVSHMGEATVDGPDAVAFLNSALTNDVAQMADGDVLYSLLCNESGGAVDDLLVYRKSAESYLLCLNASNTDKDVAWLESKIGDFKVRLADVSESYGLIALQGPKAFEILKPLCNVDLSTLGYYKFTEGNIGGIACLISRTGYTGELGYELFVSAGKCEALANAIWEAGSTMGLALAGLGARDSLRLEAGYSLYGHEIDDESGPVEANLMWTVKLGKPGDFVGKAAIEAKKANGPKKSVIFFKTGTRRTARPGTVVKCGSETVGTVVSGTFSPVLNEAIGAATVDSAYRKDGDLCVEVRGKEYPIQRAKVPFIPLDPKRMPLG